MSKDKDKDNRGWVKLYRSITDNWVFTDPVVFRAWIDILLMANHKPAKLFIRGHFVEVGAGELWTSVRKLSVRWNMTPKGTLKTLKLLKTDGMIDTEKLLGAGTLIKVLNYREFQGIEDASGNTQGNTGDYTPDNSAGNSHGITGETPKGTPVTHKQEVKNVKNEKNVKNVKNIIPPGAVRVDERGVLVDANGWEI